MEFFASLFLYLPLAGLFETALQESDGGLSWGWILLILLILALLLVWWLLGPGARKRRRQMTDLPKARRDPVDTAAVETATVETATVGTTAIEPEAIAAVPAPGAGLLSVPPAASLPAAPGPETPEPGEEDPGSEGQEDDHQEADVAVAAPDAGQSDASQSAPVPPAAEPDNLRRIEGIGPKVAGILNGAGIATFGQLADTSVEQLRDILEAEGLKFMKPDTWPEQAQLAATGDWAGLQNLQDQLKGGRRIGD